MREVRGRDRARLHPIRINRFTLYVLLTGLRIFLVWWFLSTPGFLWVALIWTAHIGFDRMLGYGLKDVSGFKKTHLQRI